MNIFNKIFNWFSLSNRWKHLCGGILVGLGSDSVYCAAYAGIGIASALEFKDKAHGGKLDWIDWGCTVGGVAIGFSLRVLLLSLFV